VAVVFAPSPAQSEVLRHWRQEGQVLVREFSHRDFDEALRFVEKIAAAAQDYLRRPDMCICAFNRVRLIIANPHRAGITDAEVRLAAKVNAIVED
jgi:pterin-4a-carbinolamine dehydratase